jgi:hypothetical protein
MGQIDYGILVSYQQRAPQAGVLAKWYQQVRLPKIFIAFHLHARTSVGTVGLCRTKGTFVFSYHAARKTVRTQTREKKVK